MDPRRDLREIREALRVLLYRKQEGGLYFHLEVTDTTCRKGADEGN